MSIRHRAAVSACAAAALLTTALVSSAAAAPDEPAGQFGMCGLQPPFADEYDTSTGNCPIPQLGIIESFEDRPQAGVTTRGNGTIVRRLDKNGPLYQAGVRRNDLIAGYGKEGGTDVEVHLHSPDMLQAAMTKHKEGDKIWLYVYVEATGEDRNVQVTVGAPKQAEGIIPVPKCVTEKPFRDREDPYSGLCPIEQMGVSESTAEKRLEVASTKWAGVTVHEMPRGGPAHEANILPADVITGYRKADGAEMIPVTDPEQLKTELAKHAKGEKVVFAIQRPDEGEITIELALDEPPTQR